MIDLTFLNNKKILITGHTGFKGRWLVGLLSQLCNAKLVCVAPRDIFFKESRVFFEKINIEASKNNLLYFPFRKEAKLDLLIKEINSYSNNI